MVLKVKIEKDFSLIFRSFEILHDSIFSLSGLVLDILFKKEIPRQTTLR